MAKEEATNEINCHIPTLVSPATLPLILMSSVEMTGLITKALGYDGMEWRPMRSVMARQISGRYTLPLAHKMIRSAEQSYRGENSFAEASQHPDKRLAQISYLLFPHRVDSIKELVELQQLVGDIPVTIYPTASPVETAKQRSIKNRLAQLSPECLDVFQVKTLEGLVQAFVDNGLGINLDILHYLRLTDHLGIPADNIIFRSMMPFVREVQFPVGRGDETYQDLTGDGLGCMSTELLMTVLSEGYQGPIVPEINPASFGMQLLRVHRRTVHGLRTFIAAGG